MSPRRRATLTVRNNDVTRVRLDLESALFVSCVSPRAATRLLHVAAAAAAAHFRVLDAEQVRPARLVPLFCDAALLSARHTTVRSAGLVLVPSMMCASSTSFLALPSPIDPRPTALLEHVAEYFGTW